MTHAQGTDIIHLLWLVIAEGGFVIGLLIGRK